ncbi:MAG: ABC transporter substrate-binding protein [Coriobacteriia bacterium]|nr:ABC transporter substrate-binding protein [Coriobacteriia bacterium]
MKIILICALLICFTLALVGCGDDKSSAADATADSNSKNSIIAYVGNDIFDNSLDPIKGSMPYGYSFITNALLKVTPEGTYAGDLASNWTISDDALTYTFELLQNVMFSDGSPLSAHDVVFTYETTMENQAENETVDLTRLSKVSATDDHTVQFVLSEPYSPFLDATAMLGIVPRDIYDSSRFDHYPIGTGPWVVVQYDPNQQVIVEPNPYYFGNAPHLDRVTMVSMSDATALAAARSGQLDVVKVNPAFAHEDVVGMTMIPLETMDVRMLSLPVLPPQEREGITIGNDVTSDSAVREALSIGIDRELIISNALNGIGHPAAGFSSNLPWADYIPVEDGRATEAKELLEAAGWAENSDGIREKDGLLCSFDVYATEDRFALVAALAENAAPLGIQIVPHSSNWDEIGENMHTSSVIWGWGQQSPTVIYSLYSGEAALTPGGWDNAPTYINPAVDAKINAALDASSEVEAHENWKEAQTLAHADFPYLHIVNMVHTYFVNDSLDISPATQVPHPHGHGVPVISNMKDWRIR